MVHELGRLVYDVEIKEVGDLNKKVVNNRIAIQTGKDETTFIDIVAWNEKAEIISKYFKKGFEILISGKLINTKKKKDNLEYDSVAILVGQILFTHGNPKEFDLNGADVPDFL